MSLWAIYFYQYYDYQKCFDCLTRARSIAADARLEIPNIFLGFGCMYQSIANIAQLNREFITAKLDD